MLKTIQTASIVSKISIFLSTIVAISFVVTTASIEGTRPSYQRKITGQCPNGTQVIYVTPEGGFICDGSTLPNSIGSVQVENNAIEARHLKNCSVNGGVGNAICPYTIVSENVNNQQVQLRITGICSGGSHVESVDNLGGVLCSSIVAPDTIGGDQIIRKSIIGFEHIQNHTVTELELSLNYAKGVPDGIASLDSSGKVPTSQLPPMVSFTNVTVCDNITCCVANQPGDVCVLPNVTYIYDGTSLKVISSVQVTSVNGQIGTVSLNSDQIPEGSTNLYLTANSVGNTQLQANSVNSANIIDMSIESVDLSNGLITVAKMSNSSVVGGVGGIIADGTIVSADVNMNSIQLRVTGICSGGGYITAVNNMGGVSCNFNAANHIAITNGNPHGTLVSQLSDTLVAGPTEGQVLTYQSGFWRNADPTGGGGGGMTTFLSQLTGDVQLSKELYSSDILVYNQETKFWQNIKRYVAQCGYGKKKKTIIRECVELEVGLYNIPFPVAYTEGEYYSVVVTMGMPNVFAYVDERNKATDSVKVNLFDLKGDPISGRFTVLIN